MKKTTLLILFLGLVLLGTNNSCGPAKPGQQQTISLLPSAWSNNDLQQFLQKDARTYPDNPVAIGKNGAITTTFHSAASRAGLEALKNGGTSVDAALTASLTQITLNAHSVVSLFGIMNTVHYDAASGEIVSMDASWNTVINETDPMTIPSIELGEGLFAEREVSGRTALVGGFMRGFDAAHARYGKLPYEVLFQPSIHLAESGFELNERTVNYFQIRDKQIRRLKETRETLTKANGESYEAGDIFKQPALAGTLKRLAQEGSDYMYLGPWAQKAVSAIQEDGGKMTLADLAKYEVIWAEPTYASYGDYQLALQGMPSAGSVNLIEALNLAYASGLAEEPHWSESGASLKKLSDITNMFGLSFLPEQTRNMVYPTIDLSNVSRMKMETSKALWEQMEQGVKIANYAEKDMKHSDTVVVIDQWGNMTAITHSINAAVWGNEAIMVDGVSISDAASIQKAMVIAAGPGNRVPPPIEVGILLKNGKPEIPFASMSVGLHQQTVQTLLNIIAFDMDIVQANEAPGIFLPSIDTSNPFSPKYTVRVMEGEFPEQVIEESDLPIQELPASERRFAQGLWVGISFDHDTGIMKAVSPPYAHGCALSY